MIRCSYEKTQSNRLLHDKDIKVMNFSYNENAREKRNALTRFKHLGSTSKLESRSRFPSGYMHPFLAMTHGQRLSRVVSALKQLRSLSHQQRDHSARHYLFYLASTELAQIRYRHLSYRKIVRADASSNSEMLIESLIYGLHTQTRKCFGEHVPS